MLSGHRSYLLVGLLHFLCATAVFADPQPALVDQDSTGIALTREAWRKTITEAAPPGPGCFQVTYPGIVAKQVPCGPSPVRPRFSPPTTSGKGGQKIVGDGKGYVLVAPQRQILSRVAGSFPSIKGVTSVSTFAGLPGERHSYTLQLNAKTSVPTSICQGLGEHCNVIQQFVYTTSDYSAPGDDAEIGISYWVLGADSCPKPLERYGSFCAAGSPTMKVPRIPATDLDKVELWGLAYPGVYDRLFLFYKDTIYMLNTDTSMLRLGEAWNWAEFNIFGKDAGGEAIFNPGSALDVRLAAVFGGNYKVVPQCANGSVTAEYNNLVLVDGSCKTWGYPNPAGVGAPYIQFSEASDDNPNVWPKLTFFNPAVSGFDKLQWTLQIQQTGSGRQWRWSQQNTSSWNGFMRLDVLPGDRKSDGTVAFSLGDDPVVVFSGKSPSCAKNNAGVTCSISYPWVLGRSYTLTIKSAAQDPTQPVWTGTVTDDLTGISTTIGTIAITSVGSAIFTNWALIPPNSAVYATLDSSQSPPSRFSECSELPFVDAVVSMPVGYYANQPAPMTENSFVGNCVWYDPVAPGQYDLRIGGAGHE
ncbi:hypothetical protein [Pandoraea pulmonicola]|uniref:Uncharacterized protein n=2 Tax=Pandoraea pulmonicola TaxID=93221 RepID=A0AAJ4Z9D0_PANPU|nr:hypothetical protein [Pandoraea pulmonicola]AJC21925.1 hypothetical protein RO07_18135 [Pandoraea pulmonicola]SUA89127.1 Uncharacterised protein [Pandoraea pulmonicola]